MTDQDARPRCTAVGCTKLVPKHRGGSRSTRPPRIADGKAWAWYCSRSCSSRSMGLANIGRVNLVTVESRRRSREQQAIARIVAACKTALQQQPQLTGRVIAKLMIGEFRIGYRMGYDAGRRSGLGTPRATDAIDVMAWSQIGTDEPGRIVLDE